MAETMNFDSRRSVAQARLDALNHDQGCALLDGREFNPAPLYEVERELDAITAAEGEAARRRRAKQAKAEAERIARLRESLAVAVEKRLDAADRAEIAAKALATALTDYMRATAEAATLVRALLGRAAARLDGYDVENRLSLRLTAALKGFTRGRQRFGQISLPAVQPRFEASWKDAEAAETADDISLALKG